MKRIILTMVIAISMIACKDNKGKVEVSDAETVDTSIDASSAETEAYSIITDKSVLTWKGFKPTGSHNGTVGISSGNLNVANDKLAGGRVEINMNSIVCLDIPAEDGGNGKLVGHLNSADFFDVEKFPTTLFEITDVAYGDEGKINVSGNLTVKGITKNITVPAIFGSANGFATLKSDVFKVDRTEFGIEYKSTKLVDIVKDKSIDDLVEMSFDVMAKK